MKAFAVVVIIVAFLVVVFCAPTTSNEQFLRVHIRADNNETAHQQVKYAVKNAVVNYLAPYLVNATTKQKAMQIVMDELKNIQQVCNQTLQDNGFDYQATVKLCQESFPDRTYNGITLPQGVYDALIIKLGSGLGNNWWCVVYPPLCFVGSENDGSNNIVFRSKLLEIINQWMSQNN
jgi:stage II sporulation protein R